MTDLEKGIPYEAWLDEKIRKLKNLYELDLNAKIELKSNLVAFKLWLNHIDDLISSSEKLNPLLQTFGTFQRRFGRIEIELLKTESIFNRRTKNILNYYIKNLICDFSKSDSNNSEINFLEAVPYLNQILDCYEKHYKTAEEAENK